MTNIFAVIGENREDPTRLLVIGDDGQQYAYQVTDGTTSPVEPDATWMLDPNPPPLDDLLI